jgi:hypothetical protein
MSEGSFSSFVATAPVATPNDVAAGGAVPIVIGGQTRQWTPHLYSSRKTQDLNDLQLLLATELIPAYQASTGLEGRIALNAIMKMTTGVINPKLPPYNCKGDLQETKLAACSAGSNVITCSEGMFRPDDVGKLAYLSNAGPSFGIMETSIIAYLSSTQVRIATNASVSKSDNQMFWGTDDTAGMLAAIAATRSPGLWTYGGVVMLPPGMYLVGPQVYLARAAIAGYGRRHSMLCRKPTSATTALLRNENNQVDFPVLQNFGLYGLQFVQRPGFGNRGLEFLSVLPGSASDTLPQVDPYPFFKDLAIFGHSWDGMYTQYRNSGDIVSVDLLNNWGRGWLCNSFDSNVVNMLAIANWYPGVDFDSNGSANNNVNNLKSSFNGYKGTTQDLACNVRVAGTGQNITNGRFQESYGCNLLVKSTWSKFGDISLDDTGCIKPAHGQGSTYSTAIQNIRAAVYLAANTAVGNLFNDVAVGKSVHGTDYLTHALYLSGDASGNKGRIWTRPGIGYGGYLPGSGQYLPGAVGSDSSGGIGATNKIRIDDVAII